MLPRHCYAAMKDCSLMLSRCRCASQVSLDAAYIWFAFSYGVLYCRRIFDAAFRLPFFASDAFSPDFRFHFFFRFAVISPPISSR